MKRGLLLIKVFQFYADGFRGMRLGKTLWLIILLKLFVLFLILKLFFFPNYLGRFDTDAEKGEFVSNELILRVSNLKTK